MQDERVTREAKLAAAKEIVASYVKSAQIKTGDSEKPALSPQEVCDFFKSVYKTIDEVIPEAQPR
ncbi:MAG: hypothetical protein K2X66_10080, partial [Cyanobacteria bacterium]|nr:hypothetical protein [Cyanobacteriota bacterium]